MGFVDLQSDEGQQALKELWDPIRNSGDRGEWGFVKAYGHSSLCRCVMRVSRRTQPNRLVPCNCWWGSGGRVGRPYSGAMAKAELPCPQNLLPLALAELTRIEFGVDFECPSCGRGEANGHAADCRLRAILDAAQLMEAHQ